MAALVLRPNADGPFAQLFPLGARGGLHIKRSHGDANDPEGVGEVLAHLSRVDLGAAARARAASGSARVAGRLLGTGEGRSGRDGFACSGSRVVQRLKSN